MYWTITTSANFRVALQMKIKFWKASFKSKDLKVRNCMYNSNIIYFTLGGNLVQKSKSSE